MMADAPLYHTEAELDDVVKRFEDCSYTPEEFVHARHLTVAAIYFLRFDAEVAKERMRTGLRQFIKDHGKDGYHVTVTEFWLALVARVVAEHSSKSADLVLIANDVVARCSDKNLIHNFYSRERIASAEAKSNHLAPDLNPFAT
jgi:hypothetical protein